MHDPDGQGPTKAPSPSKSPQPSLWPARIKAIAALSSEFVMRPRVRLSIIGAILLLIGTLLATNSVWTLPLVIVGALMILIAWIGHRLEGRFAIEWGEAGTQLALRASVKPARSLEEGLPQREALDPPTPVRSPHSEHVIDGEAHTVEIDVAELQALIDAVETTEARASPESPATDIRIHRMAWGAPGASETPG